MCGKRPKAEGRKSCQLCLDRLSVKQAMDHASKKAKHYMERLAFLAGETARLQSLP